MRLPLRLSLSLSLSSGFGSSLSKSERIKRGFTVAITAHCAMALAAVAAASMLVARPEIQGCFKQASKLCCGLYFCAAYKSVLGAWQATKLAGEMSELQT